jgi:hypothetical protein
MFREYAPAVVLLAVHVTEHDCPLFSPVHDDGFWGAVGLTDSPGAFRWEVMLPHCAFVPRHEMSARTVEALPIVTTAGSEERNAETVPGAISLTVSVTGDESFVSPLLLVAMR